MKIRQALHEEDDCEGCGAVKGDLCYFEDGQPVSDCPCTEGWQIVPQAEYSQGIAEDGAAILKDGVPMTIEEILSELRGR